jgi:hypothetical protein
MPRAPVDVQAMETLADRLSDERAENWIVSYSRMTCHFWALALFDHKPGQGWLSAPDYPTIEAMMDEDERRSLPPGRRFRR